MMDAFTDSRYGFDLVVGNPPWDKVKPYDDEFFSQYYPAFKSLNTKTKKTAKINKLLRDPKIKTGYEEYLLSFKEKSAFYRTYDLPGQRRQGSVAAGVRANARPCRQGWHSIGANPITDSCK